MLEKIKSLRDDVFINLGNPVSSLVYQLDSINLLIGDNGSGKTKLIKEIINELAGETPPGKFLIEGDQDNLGLIYYTAAPFYKKITSVKRKNVSFVDASPPRIFSENIMGVAREYIEVAKSLGIASSFESVCKFDFREFAFKCARRLAISKIDPKDDLVDLYREYQKLSSKYTRYTRERKYLRDNEHVELSKARSEVELNVLNNGSTYDSQLAEIDAAIEHIARERLKLKDAVIDKFLRKARPNNKKWAQIWVASCQAEKSIYETSNLAQIAAYIYFKDQSYSPENLIHWNKCHKVVVHFVKLLEKMGAGAISWSEDSATIKTDLVKLLRTQASAAAYSDAYNCGILQIGFDQISSGEAAILNQLTSITHAIHELYNAGRKNFLIFIDEGDILLHLRWQRQYLRLIDERLSDLRSNLDLSSVQVIIASHSPLLASDILRDSIHRMRKDGSLPSFGAPIQSIMNCSFDTPSIGAIAEKHIIRLQGKKKYDDADLKIIDQIDDDFVRQYLINKNFK